MRWVAHAAVAPHRCAAIPFIGNSNAKKGFLEVGQLSGWDPFLYLSVEAVEEMARMVGWQPNHVQAAHKGELAGLARKLEESEAENARLQKQLDAVKILKNNGFTHANPVGRPPNRKVAA